MAGSGETQTEHDLFLEQSQAEKLPKEKRERIAKINVDIQAGATSDYVNASDRIKALLQRQSVAGTPGNPVLTADEMKEIREYNEAQEAQKNARTK